MTISISPKTAKYEPNGSIQFEAAVVGAKSKAVTWKCSGNGSIDASGKFTADASPLDGPITVTATTKASPHRSDVVVLA